MQFSIWLFEEEENVARRRRRVTAAPEQLAHTSRPLWLTFWKDPRDRDPPSRHRESRNVPAGGDAPLHIIFKENCIYIKTWPADEAAGALFPAAAQKIIIGQSALNTRRACTRNFGTETIANTPQGEDNGSIHYYPAAAIPAYKLGEYWITTKGTIYINNVGMPGALRSRQLLLRDRFLVLIDCCDCEARRTYSRDIATSKLARWTDLMMRRRKKEERIL